MIKRIKTSTVQRMAEKIDRRKNIVRHVVEEEYMAPPETLKPYVKEYFDMLKINWKTHVDPNVKYEKF